VAFGSISEMLTKNAGMAIMLKSGEEAQLEGI
jgi:hypothetical protein